MTTPARQRPSDPPRRHTSAEDRVLPESRASLVKLVAGPATWALHFLAGYVTAAIWCAKSPWPADTGKLHALLWGYTAVALAVIAIFGAGALRQHFWGQASLPHDAASAGDRHRFLGFATFLLCCLSFVAVVYSAMAIALVGGCVG